MVEIIRGPILGQTMDHDLAAGPDALRAGHRPVARIGVGNVDRLVKGAFGQAVIQRVAAFRGFAGAPAYCGSKAALKAYGESLRTSHAADGIEVSVICPGFVRTPMTDVNKFPMPFLMSAENAARIIVRKLQHNHGRIAFPWPSYIFAWFLSVLPPQWTDRLIAGMPRKTHHT